MFQLPTQKAVYELLVAGLSCAVYDDVPDSPVGAPEALFPYAVVGEDTAVAWDTDSSLGAAVAVTVNLYSRYSGKKELKELIEEVYDVLNRDASQLSASGFRFIDCLFVSSTVRALGDGKTKHGICRYTITVEKE